MFIYLQYYYSTTPRWENSQTVHTEYSGRNQQSLEDHINWALPEVKDDNGTLEINEREEEAIDVDLTEPIPLAPITPKRKFSPVRTQRR